MCRAPLPERNLSSIRNAIFRCGGLVDDKFFYALLSMEEHQEPEEIILSIRDELIVGIANKKIPNELIIKVIKVLELAARDIEHCQTFHTS